MKTCSKCRVEKEIINFSKHSNTKDKLSSWCKKCTQNSSKQTIKNWKLKNPDKVNIIQNKWNNKKSGVYEWYDDSISLYIGQSNSLNRRISHHKTYFKNPSLAPKTAQYLYPLLNKHPNASIRVIEECSREVLLEREQHYIDAKKPLYNKYVPTT